MGWIGRGRVVTDGNVHYTQITVRIFLKLESMLHGPSELKGVLYSRLLNSLLTRSLGSCGSDLNSENNSANEPIHLAIRAARPSHYYLRWSLIEHVPTSTGKVSRCIVNFIDIILAAIFIQPILSSVHPSMGSNTSSSSSESSLPKGFHRESTRLTSPLPRRSSPGADSTLCNASSSAWMK